MKNVDHISKLPAPSVRKLLREAGRNMSDIARHLRIHPSVVSRVVAKKASSAPVWEEIARVIGKGRLP